MIKPFITPLLLFATIVSHGQVYSTLDEIENIKPYEIHGYSKYKSLSQVTEKVHPDSIYSLLFQGQTEFPTGFGNLTNLQSVSFYQCEELDYDKIINECLKLNNLISLTFSGISRANISKNLYKLKTLKKLTLAGNTFNTIPKGLDKLPDLEILYLGDHMAGGNKILTFPKEIINLKKLRVLSLWGNMEMVLVNEFYQLHALEELDLSFIVNLDFEKACKSFPMLKKLNITGIENTTLTGISNLTNLEELSMGDNFNLISLGDDFSGLKNLKKLDIQMKEQIYSATEINKIAALPKLENLMITILGDEDEFLFPVDGFKSLKALRIIDLTKVTISEIIDVVRNYPELESLDLSLTWTTLTPEEENKLSELSKSMTIVGFDKKK
ncbi:MAG: hypothetical protein IPH42_10930 [Bacteroidetes bacterium]|nr:hypothetical protein [Bacteroidota bacterium]